MAVPVELHSGNIGVRYSITWNSKVYVRIGVTDFVLPSDTCSLPPWSIG